MIRVEKTKEGDLLQFNVSIREGAGETSHQVTMAKAIYTKLTQGKVSPERCIEMVFEFLLANEPKEAILSSFDVTVISKYFPTFEREFTKNISSL